MHNFNIDNLIISTSLILDHLFFSLRHKWTDSHRRALKDFKQRLKIKHFSSRSSLFIIGSGASYQNNLTMSQHNPHSGHHLQKAWLLNAAIGVAGVVLNCIVLNLSIKEWKIISSINAMIMYAVICTNVHTGWRLISETRLT